jgi:radical SAM protein
MLSSTPLPGNAGQPRGRVDFDQAPFLVLWELTRACNLACRHCRAKAIRSRDPGELSLEECTRLLEQLKEFGRPLIVLTGGDPVQREDLFDIIRAARERDFPVAITPSATPSTSRDVVRRFKECGVERMAISVDGPDAAVHDEMRRVKGSFDLTMQIIEFARDAGLPIQINTTIWKGNVDRFDEMSRLVQRLRAVLWSLFFLVPTGRATQDMQIQPVEAEEIMIKMAKLACVADFDVKATAGPFFRRVLIEYVSKDSAQSLDISTLSSGMRLGALRAYRSVNDGKGVLFISHKGDVHPSGFLPLESANVRNESIVKVYREHPLFLALRDPSLLQGKCGRCKFKVVCGGSRARAFADCHDYLAGDPLCLYDQSNELVTAEQRFLRQE